MRVMLRGHILAILSMQYGKHHIRFLVNNEWRLRPDLPTEVADNGELCNVITVNAADTFHIFCNTTWSNATLRSRLLDEEGASMSEVRSHGLHHSAIHACEGALQGQMRRVCRGLVVLKSSAILGLVHWLV
jgi:hypothetical protein